MEGLWIAQFSGPTTQGAGVVLFQGDSILGGDGGYFYVGKMQRDGETITASLKVSPHSPGYSSVFGTTGQTLNLVLQGKSLPGGTTMQVTGYPAEMPSVKFTAVLTKRAVS